MTVVLRATGAPPVTDVQPATGAAQATGVRANLASPRLRVWVRVAVGGGILLALALALGAEPFLRGLASVSLPAVAAALVLAAVATTAAAWRWRVLAGRLGLTLGRREAMAAYYRSQFLNTILPGGVVGDVHRAVAHGLDQGRVAQASRAVAAERSAGQAVQLVLAAVVLAVLGMSAYAPAVGTALLVVVVACAAIAVAATTNRRARAAIRRELVALRQAFGTVRTVLAVVALSIVVALCHVATFVVACIAVGVEASPGRLTAGALIVMLAGSIPLNLGGWGPREGVAAWAFTAAGFGAATGVAASTAFGVLAMIAVLPGALVVAASALRRRRFVVADGGETS